MTKSQSTGDMVMKGVFVPTPSSSFIKGVQFIAQNKKLLIFFGRSTFEYRDVHANTARRMASAVSPGKFYHRNIRGKHQSAKVA